MKKALIVFLALVFSALYLGTQSRAENKNEKAQITEQEEESRFWRLFRRIFSRPEPSWEKTNAELTEVTGVRGLEREKNLKRGMNKKAYNYQAVRWMENYQIDEEKLREFLKSRHLGPYKRQGERK